MAGVAITRTEHTPMQLRRAASGTGDAGAARRMLALALVMEGKSRSEAAATCGMDRQTLRDWVHRYNAFGLEGLSNKVAPGPRSGAPAYPLVVNRSSAVMISFAITLQLLHS